MTILQSILLGIIQGLTEFLPISSSAHLVIVPFLLKWDIPPADAFIFAVLVQVATLLAVITYFWYDVIVIVRAMFSGLSNRKPFMEPHARLGWFLILATIPAGIIGLSLKDLVEKIFASPIATAYLLFVTAGLLLIAERAGKRKRSLELMNWMDALWIGVSQVLAIFPGISRSGATIAAGILRDLERPAAARFSFLMSIPIMLAAGLSATKDLLEHAYLSGASNNSLETMLLVYIPGFIASALVGYFAIRWLLRYLIDHSLYIFIIYCTMLGILVLSISFFR